MRECVCVRYLNLTAIGFPLCLFWLNILFSLLFFLSMVLRILPSLDDRHRKRRRRISIIGQLSHKHIYQRTDIYTYHTRCTLTTDSIYCIYAISNFMGLRLNIETRVFRRLYHTHWCDVSNLIFMTILLMRTLEYQTYVGVFKRACQRISFTLLNSKTFTDQFSCLSSYDECSLRSVMKHLHTMKLSSECFFFFVFFEPKPAYEHVNQMP